MEAEAKKTAHGFVETIKNKLTTVYDQFELSWAKATEYGAALGGGLVVGFLTRRYGRQTFITLLTFSIVLAFFVYADVVTIDWQKIHNFIGFGHANSVDTYIHELVGWAQKHTITVLIGFFGFIIGYKIG